MGLAEAGRGGPETISLTHTHYTHTHTLLPAHVPPVPTGRSFVRAAKAVPRERPKFLRPPLVGELRPPFQKAPAGAWMRKGNKGLALRPATSFLFAWLLRAGGGCIAAFPVSRGSSFAPWEPLASSFPPSPGKKRRCCRCLFPGGSISAPLCLEAQLGGKGKFSLSLRPSWMPGSDPQTKRGAGGLRFTPRCKLLP